LSSLLVLSRKRVKSQGRTCGIWKVSSNTPVIWKWFCTSHETFGKHGICSKCLFVASRRSFIFYCCRFHLPRNVGFVADVTNICFSTNTRSHMTSLIYHIFHCFRIVRLLQIRLRASIWSRKSLDTRSHCQIHKTDPESLNGLCSI
jgi:hypothetical protein